MTTTPGESTAAETRLAVLETQMQTVQDGQRQILARLDVIQQDYTTRLDSIQQDYSTRLDSIQQDYGRRFDAVNARFDRLFYTILGLGIAALGVVIALDRVF